MFCRLSFYFVKRERNEVVYKIGRGGNHIYIKYVLLRRRLFMNKYASFLFLRQFIFVIVFGLIYYCSKGKATIDWIHWQKYVILSLVTTAGLLWLCIGSCCRMSKYISDRIYHERQGIAVHQAQLRLEFCTLLVIRR